MIKNAKNGKIKRTVIYRRILWKRSVFLAGVGTLPVEFAEAVRSQGYEVVCVAVIPG